MAAVDIGFVMVLGFWFVMSSHLPIQLPQERVRVVRSNREARKRPAKSNIPAMDLGFKL